MLTTSRRFFGVLAVVLLALVSCPLRSFAGDEPDTSADQIMVSGSITLQGGYNDNLLDYSPRDIALLGIYPSPGRFSISRAYDFISTSKARLVIAGELIDNNPTSLRLRLNYSTHWLNTLRDYLTWGMEIRQTFAKKNYLSASIAMLPKYYLRNLTYRDLTLRPSVWLKTAEARFERRSYSLEIGRTFSQKLSASAGYEYSVTTYNTELQERDNSTHRAILEASYRLLAPLRVHCEYAFSFSRAAGRMLSDSLTDTSYRAHGFGLGTSMSFRNILKVPITLRTDFTYEYQQYLSEKVYAFDTFRNRHLPTFYGDKYHFNRIDRFYMITNELNYKLMRNIDLYVEHSWEQNSTNLEDSGDVGSYQTHQVNIGVEFGF